MKRFLLGLALALGLSFSAHAQSAVVVAACGTPPSTYVAGTTRYPTVDTNGYLCYNNILRTAINGIGTGTTGAVTGTLAATATTTTYICGFTVSAVGGTATLGPITVTGLKNGTFTYQLFSSASGVNLIQPFTPCIPASAVNTTIVVTTTADGTATAVDVNAYGYQQ